VHAADKQEMLFCFRHQCHFVLSDGAVGFVGGWELIAAD
jgi:hypothetical protein